MTERFIIANRIITPDGTLMQSFNRHDYKTHWDLVSKEEYMVDGGLDYLRRSKNIIPAQEDSVYSDDAFEVIRDAFAWGTRGKDGKQPLCYKPISVLNTDHIYAILDTQHQIPKHIRDLFQRELFYRGAAV